MSVIIVAPVVVKPDIDSKKASVKLSIDPLKIKGKVPKRLKIIQIPVTMIYPSFFPYTFSSFRRGVNTIAPVAIVISAEKKNEVAACSWYIWDTAAETSMNNPSKMSSRLNTRAIILKLIINVQVKYLESLS